MDTQAVELPEKHQKCKVGRLGLPKEEKELGTIYWGPLSTTR